MGIGGKSETEIVCISINYIEQNKIQNIKMNIVFSWLFKKANNANCSPKFPPFSVLCNVPL
jgi:hypothetical protein